MNTGLVASVHARLLARAKERGEDFNLILTRYGVERFLYRLSISPAEKGDRFIFPLLSAFPACKLCPSFLFS